MDRLSEVLNRFTVSAGVFYHGHLCSLSRFEEPDCQVGHIHVLRSGQLRVQHGSEPSLMIDEPTLLFYPSPTPHRLLGQQSSRAELVCATVQFATGPDNLLARSMPSPLIVPLSSVAQLSQVIDILFEEAFHERQGREAVVNRLMELFIIQLLRYLLEQGYTRQGMLAGLCDPQLSKAMAAIHQHPGAPWTLTSLAEQAAMSRTVFAERFKLTLGKSPGDYLMEWRVSCAQKLLQQGRPLNWIANEVGYEHASGLARAFRKKTGCSPGQWLRQQVQPNQASIDPVSALSMSERSLVEPVTLR
ncbi:AraC family transcriptional regulator [Motiliproteus coralliicola]|uniref:AraC family transcriptional regulator n=1 Tax=Motiliproteus coralliicola TaxID=2283196 RepID=A0A369WTL1_9GAMM|nr:AraC family transcriptional regulator [Motiliproteus coralliicola]RDE24931.1 AraC family transcriptional regulator [Motiliproteus coralliicola]